MLYIENAKREKNQGIYECYNLNERFLEALGSITVLVRGKFLFRY